MPYYKVHGYGEKTNKRRKRSYYAYDEDEARRRALQDETVPEAVERLPEEPATDRQISYAKSLGEYVDENYTKTEASDLISRAKGDDEPANDEIKEIADHFRIERSQYANQKALFNLLHSKLVREGTKEEICSWFLSRVYQKLADNHSGASRPPWDQEIQNLASEMAQDDVAYRSVCRYEGSDLIFFGEKTLENDRLLLGGSISTKSYKKAQKLLKNHFQELQKPPKRQSKADKAGAGASNKDRYKAKRSKKKAQHAPKERFYSTYKDSPTNTNIGKKGHSNKDVVHGLLVIGGVLAFIVLLIASC